MYVDYVSNHAAVDSVEAEEHPELFIRGPFLNSTKQLPNGMYYGSDRIYNIW